MSALAKEKDLEQQLIPDPPQDVRGKRKARKEIQDTQVENLDMSLDFQLTEEEILNDPSRVVKTLQGAEACAFLGVPYRCGKLGDKAFTSVLRQWDHRKIGKKFKALTEEYLSEGKSPKKLFWDNITIRVWRKKNLFKRSGSGTLSTATPQLYNGDVYTGHAIQIFLPNVKNSQRPNDYIVELVSVKVTEDMDSV